MGFYDLRIIDLINDILHMRNSAPGQIAMITKNGLDSYLRAVKVDGPLSPLAREALRIIREVYKNSNLEDKLLLFILENIDVVDITAAEDVTRTLEKLNDKTYAAYDEMLDDIKAACLLSKKDRQLRPERTVESLLTNDIYKTMVYGLTQTIADVKKFLNYEEEFWDFIKENLKEVPVTAAGAKIQCGVIPLLDGDTNLYTFYTLVPKIVDYETALVAINIYKKAYDYYVNLGIKKADIFATDGIGLQLDYRDYIREEANRKFK